MFRPYPSEEFKEIPFDTAQPHRYALSSRGRMIRFKDQILDGEVFTRCLVSGYQTLFFKTKIDDKFVRKHLYVYKMIGEFFVPKTSEDQKHVIHLDYNRSNDEASNLKWVTREEMLAHHRKSPHVIAVREQRKEKKMSGHKLSATQVMRLKKMIFDPNRKTRMRILAKQFGISEMQLYRIKSGENWSHITI